MFDKGTKNWLKTEHPAIFEAWEKGVYKDVLIEDYEHWQRTGQGDRAKAEPVGDARPGSKGGLLLVVCPPDEADKIQHHKKTAANEAINGWLAERRTTYSPTHYRAEREAVAKALTDPKAQTAKGKTFELFVLAYSNRYDQLPYPNFIAEAYSNLGRTAYWSAVTNAPPDIGTDRYLIAEALRRYAVWLDKQEAARIIAEAEAKADVKTAEGLQTIEAAAALLPAKERRPYLEGKQTELARFYLKERHPAIDLHRTDRATLAYIITVQLEDFTAGRGKIPPAHIVNRLADLDAARRIAEAIAAELEGAKAESAEGMDDSATAEKARYLLGKMGMLDSKGKLHPPLDSEHKPNTIARALYDALQSEMGGEYKAKRFAAMLKKDFGHTVTERTLRNTSNDADRRAAERKLAQAFTDLI